MTKSRITKKLVALATTIFMLAIMLMPVTAGVNEGTITVHKYGGDSISGAIANTTGEELDASDLGSITAAGYTPLEGAEFTLYQLPQAQIDAVNASITATNIIEFYRITVVGGFPVVTFTMTNGSTPSATATAAYGTPQVTDASGKAVFGNANIPDGYYVLLETDTPANFQTTSPSLIRLPLTNNDGTFNWDVHVYPKNVTSAIVKRIDGLQTPISTGDVVSFELKANFNSATVRSAADLRNDATSVYGIAEIQENFNNAFQYEPGSLEVYWLDGAGNITGAPLPAAQFQVTDTATGSPGGNLIVRLTNAGIDTAITGTRPGFGLKLKAEYVGSESAAVNTMQALIVAADASLTPPMSTTIYVPSVNIVINKRTSVATGDRPLGNVTFAIAKVPVPTIHYVPGTPASSFTPAQLSALAANYVVDATGVPRTGVTDSEGRLTFFNVDGYTNDAKSYYLKELTTVSGFQLLASTVEVKIESKTTYQGTNASWFDGTNWLENVQINAPVMIRNYTVVEVSENEVGFSLPLTGGAGTLAFTAVGIIVMIGAAVVYLNGKKKTQE